GGHRPGQGLRPPDPPGGAGAAGATDSSVAGGAGRRAIKKPGRALPGFFIAAGQITGVERPAPVNRGQRPRRCCPSLRLPPLPPPPLERRRFWPLALALAPPPWGRRPEFEPRLPPATLPTLRAGRGLDGAKPSTSRRGMGLPISRSMAFS